LKAASRAAFSFLEIFKVAARHFAWRTKIAAENLQAAFDFNSVAA
jgi:hypothetical protein